MNYEQLLDGAYKKVSVSEETERFEIPKVKGHHEGSRTIITNFSQVANHLRRKQEHLLKFLGKELASSSEVSGERLILARKLPSKVINEKVEKYTNQFVLCSNCGKPDTELVEEGEKRTLKCLACGTKKEVHKI